MRRFLLCAALAALTLICCTSEPDRFLIAKLDNQAKARALVDEGIQEYQTLLLRRGDLDKVAEVREFFVMALAYDPENILAARYRSLVDNFRKTRVSQALEEAQAYLGRQKRQEDDDYAMLLAIQTARRLDPGNAAADGLARETEAIRQRLIAEDSSRARASIAKAEQASAPAGKEKAYADAWQSERRILSLDPQNASAAGQLNALKVSLDQAAVRHASLVGRLIANAEFETARGEVSLLAAANRRVDGILGARLAAALYALDYEWARALFARKSYILADEKVDEALGVLRTDEALALKRRISDLAARAEQQASFDSSLQQIDGLIDQGALAAASSSIEALARRTDDPSRLGQLDTRRQKVRSFLGQLYDEAVADYRDENFKDAIALLRTIVSIDVGYEQAADYLDKATAKEKLVEQY